MHGHSHNIIILPKARVSNFCTAMHHEHTEINKIRTAAAQHAVVKHTCSALRAINFLNFVVNCFYSRMIDEQIVTFEPSIWV